MKKILLLILVIMAISFIGMIVSFLLLDYPGIIRM